LDLPGIPLDTLQLKVWSPVILLCNLTHHGCTMACDKLLKNLWKMLSKPF
jgi:hypothetical protein